jgi:hypothetical protein
MPEAHTAYLHRAGAAKFSRELARPNALEISQPLLVEAQTGGDVTSYLSARSASAHRGAILT